MTLDKEFFQLVHAEGGYPLSLGIANDFGNLEEAKEHAREETMERNEDVTILRVVRTEMCTFTKTVTVQERPPTP
jgi:hypothetical protein